MPVFNRLGDVAHGRGNAPVGINRQVPPALADAVGGGAEWLTDQVLLYNRRVTSDVYVTEAYDRTTGRTSEVHAGVNTRRAGAGVWALLNGTYTDSLGRTEATWAPLAVDDTTGAIAVVRDKQAGADLALLYPDRQVSIYAGWLDSAEVCSRGGVMAYRAAGQFRLRSSVGTQVIDDLGLSGVRHSGGWRVGFSNALEATVMHRIGHTLGLIVSRGHADFNPDICAMSQDVIRVATSAGQLELPSEIKVFEVDLRTGVMTLNGEPVTAEWVDLGRVFGGVAPHAPVPEPPIQEPAVSIPSADIIAAVTEAKAEVEALGYTFKTVEEASRDNYAHYTYADKQQAFLVTMRAAWKLAQKHPTAGIGLEAYNGPSGTPSPFPEDGADKYSGDIILLGKSGPSCDVLIAGVQPAAQVDQTTDPMAPKNWTRDWRAPLNPYRGAQPIPQPVPPQPPVVTPPVTPTPVVDLSVVLAKLAAIEAALARLEAREMPELPELPDLEAMGWPTYTGTAKGGWPVGNINFTLTPKED